MLARPTRVAHEGLGVHPREVAIVGALLLFLLVPWLVARDVRRQPRAAWEAIGRSRLVWTLLVVLVPVLGPVWYLRIVRRELRLVRGPTGRGHVPNP